MPNKPSDRMPMEIPAGSLAPQAISLFVLTPGIGHIAIIVGVGLRLGIVRCCVGGAPRVTNQPITLTH